MSMVVFFKYIFFNFQCHLNYILIGYGYIVQFTTLQLNTRRFIFIISKQNQHFLFFERGISKWNFNSFHVAINYTKKLKQSGMLNISFWCYFLSLLQVIIIVFLTGSLSLVTVVGNILVLLSFKVNKALKTVNNYYLLSLAFADLTIGTLSMNLYTTYIIMDQWALGPVVCDLWLAIDYVASNASVMNLLVISFDRYYLQKKIELCLKDLLMLIENTIAPKYNAPGPWPFNI